MSGTICPLYNEYHESLRWTFTEPLGTCVYNIYDEIAFIVGWLSVLSWTFALLPQIITNCKNKAAESQSFWFWLLWLLGDFCNFGGCILTKNLITNIALALVYLSFTAFACLQFIWYEYLLKKYNFTKQQKAYKQHRLLLFGRSISRSITHTHQHSPLSYSHKLSIMASDAALWTTPNFAKQYTVSPKNACLSPKLKKTLKILQRSPRMFALSSQLTKRMRKEYEAFQAQKREQEHHLFPDQDIDSQHEYDDDVTSSDSYSHSLSSRDTNNNDSNISKERCSREQNKSKSIIKIYEDRKSSPITPRGDDNQNEINIIRPHENDTETNSNPTNSSPLRATNNPNYGSMSTIISTLSSMSVTVVMLYGLNNYENSNVKSNSSRILLASHENSDVTANGQILIMIGMILGWTASLIYISSRIPQLKLMMKYKIVSGINPAFFCLTFSGNLTQCLSMLINREIYSNASDLFSKLPWLASSGVCIFQDGLILFLIYLYNTDYYKSLSQINRGGLDINTSYSKGVMMPSPHYLVTNDDIHNKHKSGMRKKKKDRHKNRKHHKKVYHKYKNGDAGGTNIQCQSVITNTV